MKKYFWMCSIVIAGLLVWPKPVSAHVLLRDPQANIGAVLHINPDDDPVAGEPSQLYFDLQDKNSKVRIAYSGYELVVTDENGTSAVAPLSVSGSTLSANYIFPAKGLYTLTLRSKSSYDQFQKVSMENSLRVSRGVDTIGKAETSRPGANMIAFGAVIAFISLAILAFNYRREIARHSTW